MTKVAAHTETLEFQAEVRQLLDLMIHSLYSNKEIFLRELISNGSDACDKLRFEALADDALFEGDSDLRIHVAFDKEARTITVSDNGVGMNRNEVIENIGTIAKSGTRQFLASLTGDQAKDRQLIGQFGVGFYSSFIVADRVTVETRRSGLGAEHGVRWESTGDGTYTLETIEKPARGTDVTLHLRADEDDFLEVSRLQHVVRKYSDHISLPIRMNKADGTGEDTVNRANALWTRPKADIQDSEYHEFYKHVAHDFDEPLAWVHSKVEGRRSYTSLFYLPKHASFDLWDRERQHGIKLYVRRVFIMDDAEHLMPNYLRFVRGVIDSDDLPLNVSREILQRNKAIDTMRAASVKKVLGLIEDIARNDKDKYAGFWQQFGRALKEGPVEDTANRERIAGLLRFASTHSDTDTQDVALADYVARMKDGQNKIYYVTAESFAAAKNSPHLEIFRKKGVEVLLLADRIDEWLITHLSEFDGKPLVSVAKGDLDLGDVADQAEKDAQQQAAAEVTDVVVRLKAALAERVKDVRVSYRLTKSPTCLVVDEHEMGTNFERILRTVGQDVHHVQPIMEVNPQHPLVRKLKDVADERRFSDWAHILFDQALLGEGGQLDDPAAFVARLNDLLLTLSGDERRIILPR